MIRRISSELWIRTTNLRLSQNLSLLASPYWVKLHDWNLLYLNSLQPVFSDYVVSTQVLFETSWLVDHLRWQIATGCCAAGRLIGSCSWWDSSRHSRTSSAIHFHRHCCSSCCAVWLDQAARNNTDSPARRCRQRQRQEDIKSRQKQRGSPCHTRGFNKAETTSGGRTRGSTKRNEADTRRTEWRSAQCQRTCELIHLLSLMLVTSACLVYNDEASTKSTPRSCIRCWGSS